jgi:hypothetical protein
MKAKLLPQSLATIAFGALTAFSMQASAITFDFSQHSGFVVDQPYLVSNDGTTPYNDIKWYNQADVAPIVAPPAGTFDTIAWGLPSVNNGGLSVLDPFTLGTTPVDQYSGLRVTGLTGSVSSGANIGLWGGWERISTVYHRNQTIDGSAYTLLSAVIYSELMIGNPAFFTDPHFLPLGFTETMNLALDDDPLNCPAGAPNATICDDLLTFPSVGLANVAFSYNGKNYELGFKIDDFFNAVTDFPACDGGPTCTVWTAEEQTSRLSVFMNLREVPEPSTLALFGVALLGLGFVARRKIS